MRLRIISDMVSAMSDDKPQTKEQAAERAQELFSDSDTINAHTDGGGVRNDLTVELYGMEGIYRDDLNALRELGFTVDSIGTGHEFEHEFDGLVCFEFIGDHR